jgi:c-di-GMP-binding flagellar brake protein YcgR
VKDCAAAVAEMPPKAGNTPILRAAFNTTKMATDTLPMALDALATALGELEDFRISSPPEVQALLKRLLDGNVSLHLSTPKGDVYTTTLRTVDPEHGVVGIDTEGVTPQLQRVLDAGEVTAVGYLDRIRVQFDLSGVVLVHGAGGCGLNAQIPREMFRFQRRNNLRVRSFGSSAPTAYLADPKNPETQLALPVVDIGIGGCALFLPQGVSSIEVGARISYVHLELDANTRIRADIVIRNFTAIASDPRGTRLGCEFSSLSASSTRALQLFVDRS